MRKLLEWIAYSAIMGGLTGTASALFLAGLDRLTDVRTNQPWLLWLLPLGGALVSLIYKNYGANAGKGNNLIVEQIRAGDEPAERYERVPAIMAPFVLLGTWATHLFGGSAGREGTAVQMGGSLGDVVGRLVKAGGSDRRMLLMCGISGGFASVFGTPMAGAVFALEVVTMGRWISPRMIIPCLIAAFTGDYATRAWGIHHLHYSMGAIPHFSLSVLLKVLVAAILFGFMSLLFTLGISYLKRGMALVASHASARSFIGGFIVVGLVYAVGSRDYLGLSLPLLVQAFQEPLSSLAFLWKTIFTVVTLGSGFMGGEVTPLFVIGGTLGNALAPLLHLDLPFLAGLGLIGVFSGAANAPAACFFLGLELFGLHGAGYMGAVCLVSYMFSGHVGIYSSQLAGVKRPRYFVRVPGLALLARWRKD
ncbi:voltage-gated chloride channel protein [Paenibacillus rhizovicinus]|uniref:Voltage-gated chloride channel protein n=1 Tax=Paenibacillus rhizovicinus TaxID=2704463 RepID=A0A6C0P7G1_9BACL|nr:chloride channel protein [Paenibacillus rhizovicinus]QHW34570.1 voltage-gated chloride channel protein [Paenibacillus rhizovicinus]